MILEQRVFYYYLAQLLGDDQEGDRYPKDKVRQHDLFPDSLPLRLSRGGPPAMVRQTARQDEGGRAL